jgi:hypothetical protein
MCRISVESILCTGDALPSGQIDFQITRLIYVLVDSSLSCQELYFHLPNNFKRSVRLITISYKDASSTIRLIPIYAVRIAPVV